MITWNSAVAVTNSHRAALHFRWFPDLEGPPRCSRKETELPTTTKKAPAKAAAKPAAKTAAKPAAKKAPAKAAAKPAAAKKPAAKK